MSRLRSWLAAMPNAAFVPLFDASSDLTVGTRELRPGKQLVCRSRLMEEAILEAVRQGLERPSWRGLLYMMVWGTRESFRPLYIGKAGRFGKTEGQLSGNLKNLGRDKSKFARWGDGNDYHIGDLSHALYGWEAYRPPTRKYLHWAEVLFVERTPLRLREQTSFFLIPWDEGFCDADGVACTLETAESKAIALGMQEFGATMLNGRSDDFRIPRQIAPAMPWNPSARKSFVLISVLDDLVQIARELNGHPVIGLDVETTIHPQQLRLVQIATRERTYVIDPMATLSLEPLRPLLGSDGPIKVIHNAAFERRILFDAGFELGNVFDTLVAARGNAGSHGGNGLAEVCERFLGRSLDKSLQLSDWSRRPLSREQLDYAAADAEVLLDLYDALRPDRTQESIAGRSD